jgi:transposase
LVTIFQFLEDVPDRQAAEWVRLRLDWKYALHLGLADPGFDFSCLCYFRQRLLTHKAEAKLFDAVLARIRALGLVKKRGKQRTDSIAVLGAVRVLSQLETVSETLRLALGALAQAAPDWVEQTVPEAYREAYARSGPDYRLTQPEREAARVEVGAAGFWLLEQLEQAGAPAGLRDLAAVQTLGVVWAQRYERVAALDGDTSPEGAGAGGAAASGTGGSGAGAGGAGSGEAATTVRFRDRTVDCTELVVTPHDAGVRAGEKRGKKWHGEKVHITETAEPDGPNFILDVTTANASSGDAETLPEIREQLRLRDLLPAEQYVDSGSISGKQLADSEAAGIELVGPPLGDSSPQEFKLGDFQIDRETKQAVCPAGQVATKWAARTERDGSRSVHIQFPGRICAACALRARCTTGAGGRSLSLREHYERVAARRVEAQTEAFRERMRARPAIEATLSELTRAHGLRRHR